MINETNFNLTSNECVFIHSDDIHYIQSDKATVITVLKAEKKHFKNIFTSKRFLSPIVNENLNVKSALNDINSELHSEADCNGIMADSIAAQLFIHMLRDERTSTCDSTSLKKINTLELYKEISGKISNEYNTITFKEAANHMHFSEPYFSKIFHNIFGMTFTQYLNTVRVAVAIEKLKESSLSITEISSDCGFNTIRNFNRVFKKLTGYSPNNLPPDYSFLYSLQEGHGLDPTLNCTEILKYDNK